MSRPIVQEGGDLVPKKFGHGKIGDGKIRQSGPKLYGNIWQDFEQKKSLEKMADC